MGPERGDVSKWDAACKRPPYHCSLLQGPMTISSMEEGKAGKIRLPREVFQSLSSQAAHMVVTVLNITQLGMFEV